MKDIYVNKDGIICACTVEVPKEPDWYAHKYWIHDPKAPQPIPGAYDAAKKQYESALQACKESAVPFDDQDHAFHALYLETKTDYKINATFSEWFNNFLKPDTFYQIEADWEIVEIMNHRSSPTAASVALYKVARLKVPAPTVATDNSGALPKPSEMAIPDMEKLRSMMEDMPEQKRIEFINEHTEAAAKILYIAFHAAKLDHGISSKMVCKDERFILRFDKENSPLTEENIKVRYQSEKPIFPEIIVESKLKETRKS